MNLGAHNRLHKVAFWTEAGREISLEKWKKELDLNPSQAEQIETILDDFAKYYRNVLAGGKSRILAILNEDQKRKFEKMMGEAQEKQRFITPSSGP